ncbi:helix-turn-helix transcriptional regulator [Botrimarina mediterranea]|uniref:Helix-turn-helix domain protein n=1 Tax=Botrimarina mediterranea TaxID=2528022 RepID=A0A518K616_9BACT|nr:helix-turn-helix transcriptional regulator [Botrimarina mediterranea]QDV73225.1 Helix-turn-helix domain protein [Botrimarina mediterranea]
MAAKSEKPQSAEREEPVSPDSADKSSSKITADERTISRLPTTRRIGDDPGKALLSRAALIAAPWKAVGEVSSLWEESFILVTGLRANGPERWKVFGKYTNTRQECWLEEASNTLAKAVRIGLSTFHDYGRPRGSHKSEALPALIVGRIVIDHETLEKTWKHYELQSIAAYCDEHGLNRQEFLLAKLTAYKAYRSGNDVLHEYKRLTGEAASGKLPRARSSTLRSYALKYRSQVSSLFSNCFTWPSVMMAKKSGGRAIRLIDSRESYVWGAVELRFIDAVDPVEDALSETASSFDLGTRSWHHDLEAKCRAWLDGYVKGKQRLARVSGSVKQLIESFSTLEGELLKDTLRAIAEGLDDEALGELSRVVADEARAKGIALDYADQASSSDPTESTGSSAQSTASTATASAKNPAGASRDPVAVAVGKEIRRLRELKGKKNASDFAKLIGRTRGQLSNWETGQKLPSLKSMVLIAKALEVPTELLSSLVEGDFQESD